MRQNKQGNFFIKQSQYIQSILSRFKLQDAKDSSIPLDPGHFKSREGSTPMEENEKYQQVIGALLYLAVAASVTILSQHNKQPTEADLTEAKRV